MDRCLEFSAGKLGEVWLFSCLLLFGVVVEMILTVISPEQNLL